CDPVPTVGERVDVELELVSLGDGGGHFSAQRRDEDVPLARAVELAEEDPLPAAETELAAVDRDEHLRADQRAAHVRGGVRAVGILDVLPGPAVVDDLLEGGLEVAGDQWV